MKKVLLTIGCIGLMLSATPSFARLGAIVEAAKSSEVSKAIEYLRELQKTQEGRDYLKKLGVHKELLDPQTPKMRMESLLKQDPQLSMFLSSEYSKKLSAVKSSPKKRITDFMKKKEQKKNNSTDQVLKALNQPIERILSPELISDAQLREKTKAVFQKVRSAEILSGKPLLGSKAVSCLTYDRQALTTLNTILDTAASYITLSQYPKAPETFTESVNAMAKSLADRVKTSVQGAKERLCKLSRSECRIISPAIGSVACR
ncbi:MAG: hypothetical protein D6797_08310 [Bdellovibrio sp.]|nr:MAG: hypothetical protein D6797_08310 [Bdellovibrio sp.]